MIYRALGLMSGSSLDGLDIAFVEFQEQAGKWNYEWKATACYPYPPEWKSKLENAIHLDARSYLLLHTEFGQYLGAQANQFIDEHQLHYQVALIASHGHTTFHMPDKRMTAQLGDGAAIAAVTQSTVVSDLRALDLAFGGQGAPIVPIGEKMLLGDHTFFLNLGGIANISHNHDREYRAFDVCPANRVLNMLAADQGLPFDDGGRIAASGHCNDALLEQLQALDYYRLPFPKSLANDFGVDVVYPLIKSANLSTADALCTYTEHIALQVKQAAEQLLEKHPADGATKMLVTGGGALNNYLVERLQQQFAPLGITPIVPEEQLVNFKEAIIMAFIGVLRWRQEYNVLPSVTGAGRASIGGALWTGQEA